jgi:hypothetical protein
MTNATLSVEAFQTAPELVSIRKMKIQTMLVQPMEDMQRLEDMKQKYFTRRVPRKRQAKERNQPTEETLEDDGPFRTAIAFTRAPNAL